MRPPVVSFTIASSEKHPTSQQNEPLLPLTFSLRPESVFPARSSVEESVEVGS